jgi:hypothetical protein
MPKTNATRTFQRTVEFNYDAEVGNVHVIITFHLFGITVNSIRRNSDQKTYEPTEWELQDMKNLAGWYVQDEIECEQPTTGAQRCPRTN